MKYTEVRITPQQLEEFMERAIGQGYAILFEAPCLASDFRARRLPDGGLAISYVEGDAEDAKTSVSVLMGSMSLSTAHVIELKDQRASEAGR